MKMYKDINLYILQNNKEYKLYLGKGGKITNNPTKGNFWTTIPSETWFNNMSNKNKGKWEDWFIVKVKYVFKGIYIENEE